MSQTTAADATPDQWGVVPQRIRPPVLAPGTLPREELVQRLLTAGRRCVALRAGAGYGKTTALRQWADADDRAVAWVGLDPADDDPVVLLRHVVRGLGEGAALDVGPVEDLLASREPQLMAEVVPALARALDRPAHPFLLVLDDLHQIGGADAVTVVDHLLDMVPEGSTIALAGRSMPAIRLARRELEGSAVELRQEDLSFSDGEARRVVLDALPDLPRPAVTALVERTEGWPAGLGLGVLALREHPDPPLLVEGLLARDRRIAEYLHEEVLGRVRPELRDFLVRAAVLDRVTGETCDAVLERDDSRALLDELTDSGNLFVVGIDTDPDGFRLHHLFADLLVASLRREDPGEEAAIRRRAALWHDAHGESDRAVRQALATGDLDFAAEILSRQVFPAAMRGEVASLQRWVEAFPAQRMAADGLLALCAAWTAVLNGRHDEVGPWLAVARNHPVPGPVPDGSVDHAVALGAVEMIAAVDGVKASAHHAAVVRDAGPGGSPWWPVSGLIEAVSLVAAGAAEPLGAFRAAELESRGFPAAHATAVAQLAWAHLRCGDEATGQRLSRDAADELAEHRLDNYSMALIVHCVGGYAAARRGDRAAHDRAADRAEVLIERMTGVVPRGHIQARLLLADAAVRLRDRGAATRSLRAAVDLLVDEPDAVVFHDWAEVLDGEVDRLRAERDLPELSAAERRVLELLPTHLSLGEIGDRLYVSRNTVKTHTLSIYRKLAVSSRSDAVDRARELHLIPPGGDG